MVPMGAELGRLATEPLLAVRSSTSERSGSLTLSTPRSPSSTPTYLLVYEAILPFALPQRWVSQTDILDPGANTRTSIRR